MVAGDSGGEGLAASTALMARDRKFPKLCAQILGCSTLDNRNATVSAKQFATDATWSTETNRMAWRCILGGDIEEDDVSYYAAAAHCKDLSGLPPTSIDVGSAEPFRDADVAYASKLWAAGVPTDLHVYGGGCHAFYNVAPESRISKVCISTQIDWIKDVLRLKKQRVVGVEKVEDISKDMCELLM
ncbi:hypothetical protein VTL71DRAFT_15644 [Oculimacula yallundae]|uniref:Alpha/beta hydrolase fold-3 domain-containing protein n=1 Tax=Oculimacula yallundae TaxID=86028 RepID=A0ABR4CII8_9HELO